MGFACDCYDGETIEFFNVKFRVARTTHKCGECGHIIMPGEEYEYASGRWDGGFETFKTCERCADLREAFRDLGYCVTWGENDLFENYADWLEETMPCPEDGEPSSREIADNIRAKHRNWEPTK